MGCWCGEEGVWTRVVKLVTEEGKEGVMTAGFCPGHRWLFALPEIRSRSWVGYTPCALGLRTLGGLPTKLQAPVLARPVLFPAKLPRASFGQFTPCVQAAPAQRPSLLSTTAQPSSQPLGVLASRRQALGFAPASPASGTAHSKYWLSDFSPRAGAALESHLGGGGPFEASVFTWW